MSSKKRAPKRIAERQRKNEITNHEENEVKFMYAVIVEWDGEPPLKSWYNRLYSYGLHVRGEKDSTPLARRLHRTSDGWGAIAQEGIIFTETEELAKQLTYWATYYGAKSVWSGQFIAQSSALDDSDMAAMEMIAKKWKKSGPKRAAEKGKYVMTCRDHMETWEEEFESTPLVCPRCSSSRINARMGNRPRFMSPAYRSGDLTLYDYWLSTRFSSGTFEIPEHVASFNAGDVLPPSPKDMVRKIAIPEVVADGLPNDDETIVHIYDLAFSISQMSKSSRQSGRLRVLMAYNIAGGEGAYMMSARNDGKLDIIDLCILDNNMTQYL